MPPNRRPGPGGEWFAFADMDLRSAELLPAAGDLAPVVCFHAQQAAEKALKGQLAELGASAIPKTHDLEALAELIEQHGGHRPPREWVDELLDFGVLPRYPGSRPLGDAEAQSAVDVARQVVAFTRTQSQSDAPESSHDSGEPGTAVTE